MDAFMFSEGCALSGDRDALCASTLRIDVDATFLEIGMGSAHVDTLLYCCIPLFVACC